jgi:hypothetical protein
MKVVTHMVFAEACWFSGCTLFDVPYTTTAVVAAAGFSVLPECRLSEELARLAARGDLKVALREAGAQELFAHFARLELFDPGALPHPGDGAGWLVLVAGPPVI